jgi:hypothetical protein
MTITSCQEWFSFSVAKYQYVCLVVEIGVEALCIVGLGLSLIRLLNCFQSRDVTNLLVCTAGELLDVFLLKRSM